MSIYQPLSFKSHIIISYIHIYTQMHVYMCVKLRGFHREIQLNSRCSDIYHITSHRIIFIHYKSDKACEYNIYTYIHIYMHIRAYMYLQINCMLLFMHYLCTFTLTLSIPYILHKIIPKLCV